MKFVEKVCAIGRTGKLYDFPAPWQNDIFKTPMFLMYTRAGTVPHLTYDSLKYLRDEKRLVSHSLPTVIEFEEAASAQSEGLGIFTGLPEYPFYISVQDPASATPTGYNVRKGVSVWANGGKKLLSSKSFMSAIKTFRPTFYQALCDSDTPEGCSNKRVNKSVDHTLTFLDECLEEHKSSEVLENVAVLGTIEGGYDMILRKKSAQQTALRAVDGFVIDGFHTNGPEAKTMDFTKVNLILRDTLSFLPSSKLRIMNGALTPEMILEAIKCGIDIFDSSYPFILTEAGEASVFPLTSVEEFFKQDLLLNVAKRSKQIFEISLRDKMYADDFKPIIANCSCYTCKNYTRAYVNHLLTTSELSAYILLMIHNVYHFSEFFECVRTIMDKDDILK